MSKKKNKKNSAAKANANNQVQAEQPEQTKNDLEKTEETLPDEPEVEVSETETAFVIEKANTADSGKKTDKKANKSEKKKNKPARTVNTVINEQPMSSTKIFLILSFLVPFLIMGVVFVKAKIHPFGDRQVLYSDCKQQYLPFLKEFQTKLKNGDSLFYTWHSGMGTNFLAIIGYYVSSPLNLLSFFVPVKYIREALAVFIMIKVGCSSLFTAIFLKHVYRRNDISLVAFGCCYAFCDFIMGYYWNTIWLDSVALLPIVALGVYCVVHEGKYKLYVITLALAFLSSYYIGYMICVFVVLWFIVQTVTDGFKLEKFCENILKMALYSVIALAMTLPVTLVSYIQLQNTVGTEDSFPEKIEIYNNFMEILSNLFSFHEPTTMEGLPNIGTGVICILMLVIFVRSKDIAKGEKIALLSLLGLLFVSLNINTLDYIWHGFHFPNLIPYRFAFLFSFTFIVIAYRAFTVFVQLDKKDLIGMCIVTIAMICISVFYLDRKAIIGSLIVAALYIIFMTLYELDLLDRRLLIIFTSLVIIAEMCFEANVGVTTVGTTSYDNYPANEEQVNEVIANVTEGTDDLFRIDQTYYSTKNDGMIYGYNSSGQFSSTSYRTLIDFTSRVGMVSKRSSFQYLLTTPVISMLLSEKYIVARDGYTGGETSLTKVGKSTDGSVSIYENKYYLPVGYMANDTVVEADMENNSVFKTQNKIFTAATGIDQKVYTILDPKSFDCENMEHTKEDSGIISYSLVKGEKNGKISVTYKAPKNGMLYGWANVKSNDEIKVKSSKIDHKYNIEAQRYVFPLGNYKKGETVTLSVDVEKSATNKICVAYLDGELLDKGYAALSDETLTVTDHTSASVTGNITVKKDGTFMTSIPYEKGWKLYVDGKITKTEPALESFISAPLKAGEHTIELRYVPEGFAAGVFIAVLALLAFIALCVIDMYKKNGVDVIGDIVKKVTK